MDGQMVQLMGAKGLGKERKGIERKGKEQFADLIGRVCIQIHKIYSK